MSTPPDELRAAVEARRELGPAHEPEIIEGFLERIERSIDRRVDERLAARGKATPGRDPRAVVSVFSLLAAIPLLGIGGGTAGLGGLLIVCLALVLVNLVVWAKR